ncbi:sulfotransferase [Endozoicomonas sp. OPT23]|uniref:sulfotransferase family protein n=1 Tax=Endozoicomonas sp. OPT23 TaxID=2072845 RepID=UPI001890B7C7|nr:sulfotransferase [Endozoicomonas sp. OPT23]
MKRLLKLDKFVDWIQPLHEIAIENTGLTDFGEDKSYLTGLRVLLESQDQYSDLHSPLHYAPKLVHELEQRLKAEQAFKNRPEILDIEIKKPLVITGMVRTGSTALQYLMARDPNRQHLQYWLSERPQPRPPREEWDDHPDYQATVERINRIYSNAPESKSMHYMEAWLPEECGHLMAQTFTDEYWQICSKVPHYNEWYEKCDMVPTYKQHKKLLQLISANESEKPWTLKYPVHLKHLKSFLKVYPDAQVIWTHRDPASVLESYTTMNAVSRGLSCRPETIDRDDLLKEQMEVWADATERAYDIRKQFPEAQFFDMHFTDYMADPVGMAKKAYDYFGIDWTPDVDQALNQWNDDNPQHKHGKAKKEPLSLTHSQINERFTPYIKQSGVFIKE